MKTWRIACAIVLFSLPTVADSLPLVKPELVGMSSERMARIEPFLKRYVDDGKLSGSISLVARRGKIVHLERAGKRDS